MQSAATCPSGRPPVLAFSHCAGNGLLEDEAPEWQRSLFSRAEFIAEEPVKQKGRAASLGPPRSPSSSERSERSRSGTEVLI